VPFSKKKRKKLKNNDRNFVLNEIKQKRKKQIWLTFILHTLSTSFVYERERKISTAGE
jgi:hypothetical protein